MRKRRIESQCKEYYNLKVVALNMNKIEARPKNFYTEDFGAYIKVDNEWYDSNDVDFPYKTGCKPNRYTTYERGKKRSKNRI